MNKSVFRVGFLSLTVMVALSLGALVSANSAFALAKLGVVDVQRVIDESKVGKRRTAELKKDFETRKSLLDSKMKALKKKQETYVEKKPFSTPEALKPMEDEITALRLEIRKLTFESEAEFGQKQTNLAQEMLVEIRGVVNKYSEDNKFDMVVEKAAAIFYKKSYEVTDEVIKLYDKAYKNVKKSKKKSPKP